MTRGELTTYVLERLGVGSSRTGFVEQVQGHLFRSYRRAVRRHELQKDVTNLALVANDPFVDLPDDWLKTLRLRIGRYPLDSMTWDDLTTSRALTEGQDLTMYAPRRYVFMDPDRIYLDPMPTEDDADGLELFYVVAPPTWTNDSDEPVLLPEDFHHLLAEDAIFHMAQNQEEFATHAAMADQAVQRLHAELELELVDRVGQASNRIRRRHYG